MILQEYPECRSQKFSPKSAAGIFNRCCNFCNYLKLSLYFLVIKTIEQFLYCI